MKLFSIMKQRMNQEALVRRMLKSRLVLGIEVLLLVLISVALGKEVVQRYTVDRQITQLKNEYRDLQKNTVDLQKLISYFQSASFQEEQARTKLGLKKQGEEVILLPKTENQAEVTSDSAESGLASQQTLGNPQRWWNFFFTPKTS